MEGKQGFLKMQEIDRHLTREAERWQGEGLSPHSIAIVLRAVSSRLDPNSDPKTSWGDQWRSSAGYHGAIAHIAKRREEIG